MLIDLAAADAVDANIGDIIANVQLIAGAADLEHVLAHTAPVWRELNGARIFITGGTGFFGCWLLESLAFARDRLNLDIAATVLTRSPEAFRGKAPHLAGHPAIRLAAGDVRGLKLDNERFTHVIHAATEATPALNRDRPMEMLESIAEGTRRTLDFAAACGARRFLLTSSGAVYGSQPPDLTHLPETYAGAPDTCDPQWAYAEGKRMAEMLCAIWHRRHGLECVIARGFAFVGPFLPLDAHFAVGNFIGNCLRGESVEIRGDGTPHRSYLYAADLAIWLWTLLARGTPMRPYNVGSERDVTIAELAHIVAATLGRPNDVKIAGVPTPGAPAERYVPSTARARAELGLQEHIGLEESIRRTAAWAVGAAASQV